MKILIWVHKKEVIANKILSYFLTRPVIDRHDEYLQVEISHDEFVKLEDGTTVMDHYQEAMIHERNPDTNEIRSRVIGTDTDRDKDWYKDQYNRNRNHKDQQK